MTPKSLLRSSTRLAAGAAGLAASAYAGCAAATWLHYGRHSEPSDEQWDSLLDAFMPRYEVVERHLGGLVLKRVIVAISIARAVAA